MRSKYNQVAVVGALLGSLFLAESVSARVLGLDNEGCEGARQSDAVLRLRERLPPSTPISVSSPACSPENDYRCDGGFMWLPYLINQERGWVLYTLPKKGNWVGLSFRNICTQRKIVRAEFLNESESPYLLDQSAYAVGWAMDKQQELYHGYDNLAVGLSRPNGEYLVRIYGLNEEKMESSLLDSFTMSPL